MQGARQTFGEGLLRLHCFGTLLLQSDLPKHADTPLNVQQTTAGESRGDEGRGGEGGEDSIVEERRGRPYINIPIMPFLFHTFLYSSLFLLLHLLS